MESCEPPKAKEAPKGKKAPAPKVPEPEPVEKKDPDYSIYNPHKLAMQFKPPVEKRNDRRDKANEAIIMSMNMSAAVKVACFELQQVHA